MTGNNRSHPQPVYLCHYRSNNHETPTVATQAQNLSEAYSHCTQYLSLSVGVYVANDCRAIITIPVVKVIGDVIEIPASKGQAAVHSRYIATMIMSIGNMPAIYGLQLPRAIATQLTLRPGKEDQKVTSVYRFRKVTGIYGNTLCHHLKIRRNKSPLSLQKFFLSIAAMNLFANPVVSASSSISKSDRISTAAINGNPLASSNSSASTSQVSNIESKAFRSFFQGQGLKLSLFVSNTVLAFFILYVSHWIYSTFCYSRLRTIDKTRKRGIVCMILYQAAYFHIRDDSASQTGLLLGYLFFLLDLVDAANSGK